MNPTTRYASPFDELIGTEVVSASGSSVVARLKVTERLHQPTGLLPGGVSAAVIETVTSVGATSWLVEQDRAVGGSAEPGDVFAVGVSNHTDFIKATRSGLLTFSARPIQQGRLLQTWVVEVTDEADDLVAHGNVKLANRTRR